MHNAAVYSNPRDPRIPDRPGPVVATKIRSLGAARHRFQPGLPGFWSTYRTHMMFALIAELVSILALILLTPDLARLGQGTLFYFGLVFSAIVASAALPIHWYLRHRRFRAAWDSPDDDMDELGELGRLSPNRFS